MDVLKPLKIFNDNLALQKKMDFFGTLKLVLIVPTIILNLRNPIGHSKLKHAALDLIFVQKRIENSTFEVAPIPGTK